MQGYSHFERPHVQAKLMKAIRKKDPRRIFDRATLTKNAAGEYEVMPAKNQSSGLFGPIQRSNCFIVLPEGPNSCEVGDVMDCVLLDIPEEVVL